MRPTDYRPRLRGNKKAAFDNLTKQERRILVVGDIHAPFNLDGYLDFCKDTYAKYNCNQVIFIGDIDQLASEGALFTNAYAASPVCSPTRAAIFTGKYPTRVGITDWIPGQDPKNRKLLGPEDLHQLPLEEVTLAEQMKENGYKTFFAGKWHLGSDGYFPEQQGFDLNYGGHHMGQPPGGYYSPYNNPKLNDGPE